MGLLLWPAGGLWRSAPEVTAIVIADFGSDKRKTGTLKFKVDFIRAMEEDHDS